MRISDWSSDVCSSDLVVNLPAGMVPREMRLAHFETAQKIGEMIHPEGIFAVVSPTARSRALVTGATRPGTVAGEFIRNVALFKSFMVSHRSEEHTSELQSLMRISSAVFCLTKNSTN